MPVGFPNSQSTERINRFRTPFLCFLVCASGIVAGLCIVLTALVAG